VKLYHKESGEGKPFVFLHGLFGSSINWNSISQYFNKDYKVFLIDQRNHGRSPHDSGHDYDLMSEDLNGFFIDHDIDRAVVLGHSMGGKTAMRFAAKYPGKVSRLIVVDISPGAYTFKDENVLKGMFKLTAEQLLSRASADEAICKYIPDLGVRQFILQNLYWNEQKKLQWRLNIKAIGENVMNVGSEIDMNVPFKGPSLFVKGGNSDYIQAEDHAIIEEKFPNSTIETIAGAGHWIHADKPLDFVRVVSKFLKDE
jgi:pimeloyl-ACP methyl ester carboxylesterase